MKSRRVSNDCGSCKYWIRRESAWGRCHRNAPSPYVLGPIGESYFIDWQKTLREQVQEKSKGKNPDWAPPSNWRILWPDTSATDFCGEWEIKE